jgi:hypothetical protein
MPATSLWAAAGTKKLLVLVNPAAGKGKGVEVYERDVAPVLACMAGHALDVRVTR